MFLISVTNASSTIILATTEEFQAISSPNYPKRYPVHVELIFIIHSPEGSNVKLSFVDLSLDSSNCLGCRDHLIIYDGK